MSVGDAVPRDATMDLARLHACFPRSLAAGPPPGTGKEAAVLVPVYEGDGGLYVVLARRSQDVPHHKGQIAFPGGTRDESDADLRRTALREAEEEIALPADRVEVLGQLDVIHTITDFVVTPFVGVIPPDVPLVAEGREIVEVLRVPLGHVADPAHQRVSHVTYGGRPEQLHFFDVGPDVIWGATGRILRQLLDILKEAP